MFTIFYINANVASMMIERSIEIDRCPEEVVISRQEILLYVRVHRRGVFYVQTQKNFFCVHVHVLARSEKTSEKHT